MKTRRPRRGYVLLMTLLLITLAGMILAAIASHSMSISLESRQAQRSLQNRWAMASIQEAVIGQRRQLLTTITADLETGEARTLVIGSSEARFSLGGTAYLVRLDDEQAKVNLNWLSAGREKETVTRVVEKLSSVPSGLKVSPKPIVGQVSGRRLDFGSFGQVFQGEENVRPAQLPWMIDRATRNITLWSPGGRLHFRAASDESLRVVCNLVLNSGETAKIVKGREENPEKRLDEILSLAQLTLTKLSKVKRLLVGSSQSHSVWIHAQDSQSVWHRFMVRDTIGQGTPRIYTFTW